MISIGLAHLLSFIRLMILSCVLCNKKIDFYPLVFPDRGVKVLCVRKNFHYNFVLGSMEDYLKCRSLKVFKYLIHASDRVSGRFFFKRNIPDKF